MARYLSVIDAHRIATSTALGAALLTAGCSARILSPSANDAVRGELATRTRERDAALARVSELETEVARLSTQSTHALDADAIQATPALASVGISTLSAAKIAATSAGSSPSPNAMLSLVIVPIDGFGRVIQVVGNLKVSVAALVPGEAPIAAAAITVTPLQLRDAYRSGFLGAHYTIEVPLNWEVAGLPRTSARAFSVSVEFTDAASGRSFPAAATIPVVPARSAGAQVGSS